MQKQCVLIFGPTISRDKDLLNDLEKKFMIRKIFDSHNLPSIVKKRKVKLVLFEIIKETPNAIEIIKMLKSYFPKLEIILIDGNGDRQTIAKAFEYGVRDAFRKPYKTYLIVEKVNAILKRLKKNRMRNILLLILRKVNMIKGKYLALLLVLISIWAVDTILHAQNLRPQYYNPDDQRYKYLALKKAELYLKQNEAIYQRSKALYEKGLIAKEVYEKASVEYQHAKVSFQQAMLNIIFDKPHITIEKAVKYQTEQGKKRVKLTLRNTGVGAFDLEKLQTLEMKSLMEELKLQELTDVYISIKKEGTIVGQPYEAHIPIFRSGEKRIADFLLLQDLNELVVAINYADKIDEKKIYLQLDASMNMVVINSTQFSQEADLGSKAIYDLILERFASDYNTFKLAVLNLPTQITYEFSDPVTGAKLSQVRFTEGTTSKKLSLILYLPEVSSPEIVIDQPINFYVLVLDKEARKKLQGSNGIFSEAAITEIDAGKVKLELIPKGRGKIEMKAVNLYYEIRPDETVQMSVIVSNEGTRRLDNIRIKTDIPHNWQALIEPDFIESLMPDKEQMVKLTFIPPADLTVGDYEVKIKPESVTNNRKVESEDKIIRIHVISKSNIFSSMILASFLITLVVGIVIVGIKLSKR